MLLSIYEDRFWYSMSMILILCYDDEDKSILLAGWPSGLRRRVKAAVRKGVGSNPTSVTFVLILLTDIIIRFGTSCVSYNPLYNNDAVFMYTYIYIYVFVTI